MDWGEFRPSLEDVVMLASLSMCDEARVANFNLSKGEDMKRFRALTSFLSKSKYLRNKGTYLLWVKYFTGGAGRSSPHHVDGFLASILRLFESTRRWSRLLDVVVVG